MQIMIKGLYAWYERSLAKYQGGDSDVVCMSMHPRIVNGIIYWFTPLLRHRRWFLAHYDDTFEAILHPWKQWVNTRPSAWLASFLNYLELWSVLFIFIISWVTIGILTDCGMGLAWAFLITMAVIIYLGRNYRGGGCEGW